MKEQDYYSEQVQEIMGTIPSGIIRWGITVIASIFILITIGCCIIKYPQTVSSAISIISANPPAQLEVRYPGIIDTIAVANGQSVRRGSLIALLKTPAVYGDIMDVKNFIESARYDSLSEIADNPIFETSLHLGSLQCKWTEIYCLSKEYQLYCGLNQIEKKWLEPADYQTLALEQKFNGLEIRRCTENKDFNLRCLRMMAELLSEIDRWTEMYAIISPFDGVVSLSDFCGVGQYVNNGDILATVVQKVEADVEGRMKVSSDGFGKIAVGQLVNIRLNGFPYMEYGILKGVISGISQVPQIMPDGNVAYNVEVSFPNGLVSTYRKVIPFIQNMDGKAEIVTRDQRLIDHFVNPIISLYRNQ